MHVMKGGTTSNARTAISVTDIDFMQSTPAIDSAYASSSSARSDASLSDSSEMTKLAEPSDRGAGASGFEDLELFRSRGSDVEAQHVNRYIKTVVDDGDGVDKAKLLGTLVGVFFPVFANTLDAIIFLRMPWIVGQGGFAGALAALVVPAVVTILTALSLSAIATNGKVPAGGPYYLVTRALGPELGLVGAVFFYLCDTLYAGFCTVGATETLLRGLGMEMGWRMQMYGACILLAMFVLTMFGTRMVALVTPFALAGVAAAAMSVIIGAFTTNTDDMPGFSLTVAQDNAYPELESGVSIITLIGLFFPCYSGVVSGAYRSGVLKDPSKSIPTGTVGGVFAVTIGYMLMIMAYGSSIVRGRLLSTTGELASAALAPAPWVVTVGTMLTAIGAALQGLSGTPHLLVAISKEKNLPVSQVLNKLLTFGHKKDIDDDSHHNATESSNGNPPFMSLLITLLVAAIPVSIGSVDAVAPVVTMAFTVVYGTLNLSCFINAILKQPNWRPRWKWFSWMSAFVGLLGCVLLMILINPTVASAILIFGFVLLKYIQFKHVETNWGDGITGLRYQSALDALLQLPLDAHARNWRPQVLALIDPLSCRPDPEDPSSPIDSRCVDADVLRFIAQLKTGHGLTIAASVTSGSFIKSRLINKTASERSQHIKMLSTAMQKFGVEGFPVVVASDSHRAGVATLLQCTGLGGMTPNTVVLAWQDNWVNQLSHARDFFDIVEECTALQKAVVVVKGTFPDTILNPWGKRHRAQQKVTQGQTSNNDSTDTPLSPQTNARGRSVIPKKEIHIWWIVHDGGLLLLLAHLLKNSKTWKGSVIRIYTVARLVDNSVQMKKDIQKFLYEARISIESVEVVEMEEGSMHEYTTMRTLRMEERRALLKEVAHAKDLTMIGAEHMKHHDHLVAPSTPKTNDNTAMMSSALKLNAIMKRHSGNAQLLLLNLPNPSSHIDPFRWTNYISELTSELPRALLVKGSSTEIISNFE